MIKLQPPFYFLLCLILSLIFDYILPLFELINEPYHYIGLLILLLGIILTIWSDQLFKKSQTAVKSGQVSNRLIIKGPYTISRNPMYIGMILILLGVSFLLGSLTSFISPLAFFLVMSLSFIPLEERMLAQQFGEKYLEYQRKVRRWL